MAYIKKVSQGQLENVNLDSYRTARESMGRIYNHIKNFSLRHVVYEAWFKLLSAFRSHMRLPRYELMTFSTALEYKYTCCLLAHAPVLRKNFFNAEQIIVAFKDFQKADLTPEEVALMAHLRKIAKHAIDMSKADVEALCV